jgi:adenylate cyclase
VVRPRRLHAGLLLLGALLVALWAVQTPVLRLLDTQIHDLLTRATTPKAVSSPSEVVFVDIDEASLAQLGPWPWPRALMADLVERLRDRGARLQVWDLYLPEAAKGDQLLSSALSPRGGRPSDVVLGQVLVLDPLVLAPPRQGSPRPSLAAPPLCSDVHAPTGYFGLAESLPDAKVGHITATPEIDGGLRRLPAVICQEALRFPQLTLVAAELLEPDKPWVISPGGVLTGPATWLQRGQLRFALDNQGFMPIPYRRPHTQWPAVSALKVLEGHQGSDSSAWNLKGKVVVVGATALGMADAVRTPFHANAPGASVHAELMVAALNGRWLVSPAQPALPTLLLVGVLGLGLVFTLHRLHRPSALAVATFLAAAVPALAAVAARSAEVAWPIAAPTLGLAVLGFALGALQIEAARRQAGLLTRHLESFLPRDLAREIARQHPSSETLGRPEAGVVLALRVVGLERWSAAVDSLRALGLVHGVSSLAERHARLQGGTLEHLQGDTLLLAWPVTAPSADIAASIADSAAQHSPDLSSAVFEPQLQQSVQQAVIAARGLFVEAGALLAGVIQGNGDSGKSEGAYFGWWNFAIKLNLALAAGLALPLLGLFGYSPGARSPEALNALVTAYCVLPCVLKLAAGAALYFLIIQPSSDRLKATA